MQKSALYSCLFLCLALVYCSTPQTRMDNSKTLTAYLNLSQGYLNENLPFRAVIPLRKALKIAPKNPSAWLLKAQIHRKNGDLALAKTAYQKALRYGKNQPEIADNYGSFLYEQKHFKMAYGYFLSAATNTNYKYRAKAYQSAGMVASEMAQMDRAKRHFLRAIGLNQNLAKAHLGLAKIYFEQGSFRKAHNQYQHYKKLEKPNQSSLILGKKIAKKINKNVEIP